MAPNFDCAASGLLCSEDNSSIFCDEVDLGAIDEDFELSWNNRNYGNNNQNKNFDGSELLSDFPVQSDECFALMLKKETEHLPASDYLQRLRNGDLDLGARREAVDWIGKVVAHFNFGPLCKYLSISYLDRFLSVHELSKGKAWMMQLLAVSCLSLAAKMEETDVHLPLDLQVGECKFVFEAITIQRMELMVLSTLKWRMQAITPFSFIDYFLAKINGDDKIPPRSSIFVSTQLILGIIKGIDFLEFRPSEVAAAAAAVSVAGEAQTVDIENPISFLTQHVEKEKVVKCVEMIQESSLMNGSMKCLTASIPVLPQSPIGVLDAACLSYKTDETTVGSCANSTDHNSSSPNTKRRKLNRPNEVEEI
ncbi:cyclin-D3-1-like [Actinidia eriantha]|uniref:cyclin-D3-1-like n=1 Tax=Actinidia eriantha TaxID=165200 RepID=UPI002585F904|nr:cyclin-D3-1-like [Actinidia eriantha]